MRESSILLGFSTVVVAVLCVYISIWQGKGGSSLLVQVNERLESLVFYVYLVPVSVLDLSGSVLVCLRLRTVGDPDRKRSWLETLLSCTLMQFGGTTLTGLLLGQTPSWILSHNAFPALLLAWWLTFYCPGDVYFSSFTKSGLAKTVFLPVVTLLSAVSSGHAVTSWGMDKALSNAYHKNAERIAQSALTCILAGTFSACGGGILSDCLSMLQTPSYKWRPPTMLQDSKEGYAAARAITKSFFLATLYYLLRLPTSSSTQALLPLPSLSAPLARLVVALLQLQSATVVLAHGDDPQYANLSWLLRSIVLNPGGNSDSDSRQDDSNPNSGNEKPTRDSRDRSRSRGVKRN